MFPASRRIQFVSIAILIDPVGSAVDHIRTKDLDWALHRELRRGER